MQPLDGAIGCNYGVRLNGLFRCALVRGEREFAHEGGEVGCQVWVVRDDGVVEVDFGSGAGLDYDGTCGVGEDSIAVRGISLYGSEWGGWRVGERVTHCPAAASPKGLSVEKSNCFFDMVAIEIEGETDARSGEESQIERESEGKRRVGWLMQ